MPEKIDLTGKRFGRLEVIEIAPRKKGENIKYLCKCDCGNTKVAYKNDLKRGFVRSCGCLQHEVLVESHTKHNLCGTNIYNVYNNMKARCYNPNNHKYARYGGRGITICQEWLGQNGFINFSKWAFENGYQEKSGKEKLTLDRINNDGNYEPSNCRWTDYKTQARNRSSCHYVTLNGITKTLTEWCEIYNISYEKAKHDLLTSTPENVFKERNLCQTK
jgi:hypothetical protein